MTHTAHPYGLRLGIIRGWKSRWFSRNEVQYKQYLKADTIIREFLKKRVKGMYVSDIEIDRSEKLFRVIIRTSRPGLLIGRSGEGVIKLKKDMNALLLKHGLAGKAELKIDIEEVRSPESQAAVVAEMVGESLEKRLPFRRVLKQTVERVMANRDVLGVRIAVAGRLGGAEMSRSETIKRGRIPLQTLRADVDYHQLDAYMPCTGLIGIKVWIFKGVTFEKEKN